MKNSNQPNLTESPDRPPTAVRGAQSTLQCSERGTARAIETGFDRDKALRAAELRCTSGRPIIVSLLAHGHELQIGLGRPDSFVSFQRRKPTPGPGSITIGATQADRGIVFYYLGSLQTEIPSRSLLPATKARQILREFFKAGTRSTIVDWETM